MAWRAPDRKEVAERLGGQKVGRGAECPGGHREPQKTPERPGGRRLTRRALGDQKGAEVRVARKAPSRSDCADQSGAGVAGCAGRAAGCVERLGAQGRCCVESSVSDLHSMTNLASSWLKESKERVDVAPLCRFQDALLFSLSGAQFWGRL